MSTLEAFIAQEVVTDKLLACGCRVGDTRADSCLECPHLQQWLKQNDCEALLPVEEDFKTNPRNVSRPLTPVTWRLREFTEKPGETLTDHELAEAIGCSWQRIRKNRLKGHGLLDGYFLAGWLKQDSRGSGARKKWLWQKIGA